MDFAMGEDASGEDILEEDSAEEMAQGMVDLPGMQEESAQFEVLNEPQLLCQATLLVTNAACLMERSGEKFAAFHNMVKSLDPQPDIIVVHEFGGYSGGNKVRIKLVGALRRYACVYTQKPLLDAGAHKAGAGVLILFKRELFREEVLKFPYTIEKPLLLYGHIRTVCLWRKQYPHLPPLIVTAAYIPPVRGGKFAKLNQELRSEGLTAIPKIVDHVSKTRGKSHHVIVTHVNASDGCIDLDTTLSKSVPMSHVADLAPDTTPLTSTTLGM